MDSTTAFYVLSTVAECLAAFIGFASGFLFFRMQGIQDQMDSHMTPILRLPLPLDQKWNLPERLLDIGNLKEFLATVAQLRRQNQIDSVLEAGCIEGGMRLAQFGYLSQRMHYRFRVSFFVGVFVIAASIAIMPFVNVVVGHYEILCVGVAASGIVALALFANLIWITLSMKPSKQFIKTMAAAIPSSS
jgi:hypothetical protein